MGEFGYAGRILRVDLSQEGRVELPTADYARKFLGGRGIAAKIYWDEVSPQIQACDPANCLVFITGPVAGFIRLSGSRWQICGKSPATNPEVFSYSNLGGSWGVWLKSAGYDGIIIQGKADKPRYLFIHDGTVEIRDASFLWGKTALEAQEILKAELGKEVRVVAIGPAGENLVSFATMLADDDSTASGGFGSVMGSKMLKAIAVAGNWRPQAANPDRVQKLAEDIYQLRKGTWDVYMPAVAGRTKRRACYGCGTGCLREVYQAENGKSAKFFCQASNVYQKHALKYYGTWTDVIFHATRLCNEYGLDTLVMQSMIEWLARCHQEGILSDEETGIPLSRIGSSEFIEVLIRKISLKEGFGEILAKGTAKAAELVGKGAKDMMGDLISGRANESMDYDPRLYITTQLLFATEPRRPIQQLHEVSWTHRRWLEWRRGEKDSFLSPEVFHGIAEKFWGGKVAADYSTYEGKALAAKKIQDREYAIESLILCDFLWPVIWVRYADNHVGDPTLEGQVFSAITGRETDEEGMNKFGERIFNLQRAILMREGWGGRQGDRLLDYLYERPLKTYRFDAECLVPGKNGEPVSRKGEVVEREKFEQMKSEYYELRGWDISSGLQTKDKLVELELADVAKDLAARGLIR